MGRRPDSAYLGERSCSLNERHWLKLSSVSLLPSLLHHSTALWRIRTVFLAFTSVHMIFSINVLDIDQTVILRPATVNLTDQDAVHQFCRSPNLSLYHYTAFTLHCSHIYPLSHLTANLRRIISSTLSHPTVVLLSFSLTSHVSHYLALPQPLSYSASLSVRPSLSCSPTQLLSSITADNDDDNRSCRSPACPDFGWHHLRLALPCSVCRELCSRSFRSTLRYAKLCWVLRK